MRNLELIQGIWAGLTSIGTDEEVVTEAAVTTDWPARTDVTARLRLTGLWARGPSTSGKDNRAARGNRGWQSPKEGRRFARGGGRAVGHCEDKKEEVCAASRGVIGRGGVARGLAHGESYINT